MLGILKKLLDIILISVRWVVIFILSTMTIFLFIAVLSRYLFGRSIYWIDAYSRYSLIWISFLGSVMALRKRKHIGVGIVIDQLPQILRKWIIKVDTFLILVFSFTMFIQGVKLYKLTSRQIIPDLNIKMSNVCVIIPISGVLLTLVALEIIFSSDKTLLNAGFNKQVQ